MIVTGDKIKLVRKIGNFDKIGDIFDVTGIENGVISFKCNYGTGCMSYDEFENHFEKIVKRTWSEWEKGVPISASEPYTKFSFTCTPFYRTNGKIVQVRGNGCKAHASCYNKDKFSLGKGYDLAIKRLIVKLFNECVEQYAKSL